MHDVLKLQQRIVPELLELLDKRYSVLKTIYYNQPIGRRILANKLNIGERIVRTEINFLKAQDLIEINAAGMTITSEGEMIIDKLKEYIHELKGLYEIENRIKESLMLKEVIVVPGNVEEDETVMNELGKVAASYLKSMLKDNSIIALTGGYTIKEVVDNVSKTSNFKDVLVVPARGGIGKNVETQANTLAAVLAKKVNGSYKMLHVPDNLSDLARNTILNERDIKDILETIENADFLLYGIGRADEMARRRGLTEEEINEIIALGAVGEAFGYYFSRNGEVVYNTQAIGVKNENLVNKKAIMAVSGGKNKAEAIMAVQNNHPQSILITDESAAREIINML